MTTRNREEERKKIFVILGGSLALALICGVVAYFQYDAVKSVREQTATVEAQIEAAETKRERIPDLEREVIVLRENVAEYVKILPDDREVNDFVTKINEFADASGVVVTTLDDVARLGTKKKQADPFERVAYNINLTGDIDEVMTFISYFENHERFVKIPSFTIKAAKRRTLEEGGKARHEVEMMLETFVYNQGGSGLSRVTIPSFDAKRDKFEAEILKARRDISIDKYPFTPNEHRRDPFLDPRVSAVDAERITLAKQRQKLAELQGMLAKIDELRSAEGEENDLLKKSELRRRTDDAVRDLAAMVDTAREEDWFTLNAIQEELEETVVVPLEAIVVNRGIHPNAAPLTVADLEAIHSDMEELFHAGEYEQVIEQFEALFTRMDAAEQGAEFHALLQEVVRMKDHAAAILEFQEREIRILGIVYSPSASTAIINGMVVAEGDPVDDEVLVAAIHEDEVEFLFREIRISKLVQQ